MENSHIEWTTHTFNPWIGCTKVSPGCLNCYAETLMDTRYGRVKWGKGNPRQRTSAANWKQPLKWNATSQVRASQGFYARPRVFCASLADWLDDEVPIEWLADLLTLIRKTPNLDWLLLTKRPQNFNDRIAAAMVHMDKDVPRLSAHEAIAKVMSAHPTPEARDKALAPYKRSPESLLLGYWLEGKPPANVWIGTTVEDQARADERIPALLQIPAKVRFLSCEPLLERVQLGAPMAPGIHWVIVGGESGAGSRPMLREWAIDLRDQCQKAGVAFHFKQWGGANKKAAGRELDGQTYSELPA